MKQTSTGAGTPGPGGTMLRLRDIMTTDLLSLAPEVSLRDAMAALAARHVSGAPVLAGTKVLGVVSATDLLSFASGLPGVPTERPEVPPWDEQEATEEWQEGDEPPGTFYHEMWSDTGAEVDERMSEVEGPEWNVLAEHVVGEAMNPVVCSLPPETPVDAAADYMRAAGIHRVLVMHDQELLGIVSTRDIADAVADHKLTSRAWVFGPKTDFDERGWPERRGAPAPAPAPAPPGGPDAVQPDDVPRRSGSLRVRSGRRSHR
jgi:CBS domain-containing protein